MFKTCDIEHSDIFHNLYSFVLLRMTLIGALCNPFTGILLDLGFSGLLFFFDTTLEL